MIVNFEGKVRTFSNNFLQVEVFNRIMKILQHFQKLLKPNFEAFTLTALIFFVDCS